MIEDVFGDALIWDELTTRKACSIYIYGEGLVDNIDEDEAYVDWFFDRGIRFRNAIDAYLGIGRG